MIGDFVRDQLLAHLRESFPEALPVYHAAEALPPELQVTTLKGLKALQRTGDAMRLDVPGEIISYWSYVPRGGLNTKIRELEELL